MIDNGKIRKIKYLTLIESENPGVVKGYFREYLGNLKFEKNYSKRGESIKKKSNCENERNIKRERE